MVDVSAVVTCDAELEAAVGARPGVAMLKSIRFLDEHCERFLAHSPFLVIGSTTGDGELQAIASGGAPGFVVPRSDSVLDLGELSGNELIDGAPAGVIAFVPGYGETLRINGRLRVTDGVVTVEVDEVLLHCAKAILRSGLWEPLADPGPRSGAATPTVEAFLEEAPFVVLASIDAEGHADASPKGDPPGLIRWIDETKIAIADRPGNRRTDTLHNLMDDARIALLALRPGSDHAAEVRGTARVCTDGALLESMRLRDRTPKAALVIDVASRELRQEPALATADLWNPGGHVADDALPRAAEIWADHVRRNTDTGTGAAIARRLVSRKALAAGIAVDYRTNL